LEIKKEKDGRYSWNFKFKNGKSQASYDKFNTKAEAQKDFNYRAKYIKIGAVKKLALSKHKDTNSHNVNIKVMSGNRTVANQKLATQFVKKEILKDYEILLNKISKYEKYVRDYSELAKDKGYNINNRKSFASYRDIYKKYLSELKTSSKELKKLL